MAEDGKAHRHLFNGGLLTPATLQERYRQLADPLTTAIIAESARWGDTRSGVPLTRDEHWLEALLDTRFLAPDVYFISELPSQIDMNDVWRVCAVVVWP